MLFWGIISFVWAYNIVLDDNADMVKLGFYGVCILLIHGSDSYSHPCEPQGQKCKRR